MESSFAVDRTIKIEPGLENRWENLKVKTAADGLAPVVVQDFSTGKVLMLGYLNADSWQKTLETGLVTFFSRSKNRLWTKGETSGNHLRLLDAALDCDRDTFLLKVEAVGPVCHTGTETCWAETANFDLKFLEKIIRERQKTNPENSYTASLFSKGLEKIAQKVGEEAIETIIEALGSNREKLLNESADLLFHLLVLLAAKDVKLAEVEEVLRQRHSKRG